MTAAKSIGPRRRARLLLSPAGVIGLVLAIYLGTVLSGAGWDPLVFVRIGEKYQVENAVDPEGYDGQVLYYIARDPHPYPRRSSPFPARPRLPLPAHPAAAAGETVFLRKQRRAALGLGGDRGN